jgi:hypothetical protein
LRSKTLLFGKIKKEGKTKMIKAKKGLLIALFAAMMVFAFGATSAFASEAAQNWTWNTTDYTSVTIDGNSYPTVRTVDINSDGTGWDGEVYATIDTSDMSDGTAIAVAKAAGAEGITTGDAAREWLEYNVWTDYYVLSNSAVDLYGTQTQDDFVPMLNYDSQTDEWTWKPVALQKKLVFSVPSYVTLWNGDELNAKQKKAKYKVDMNVDDAASGWRFDLADPEGFEANLTTNQTFNLITTPDMGYGVSAEIIGTVPVKTITVKGVEASAKLAKFYMDSESELNEIDFYYYSQHPYGYAVFDYDGAAHTIVMGEMSGYTVAWSILNTATGQYDTVLSPSITDCDLKDKPVRVKAVVTNTAKASDTETFYMDMYVDEANDPYFLFDDDGNVGGKNYAIEGSTYNVMDYVVVDPDSRDAADKAAVEANKELLMSYFNDYYVIEEKATKANPNTIRLTMDEKDLSGLTTAERKALTEKYKQLKKNFGVEDREDPAFYADEYTANLYINGSYVVPEIEFTNTPTAVTYKAKALKKKAKSFTATATANNGAAVQYKLINAPAKITIDKLTGKVTLKKGLKKGTYKVKVKAYLVAPVMIKGIPYDAAETQAITIKVKK